MADAGPLPRLCAFATLRHERFGAIAWNPYLAIERELDPVEAFAAAMCTGEHAFAQIEAAVASRFGLTPEESARRTAEMAEKLGGMAILAHVAGPPRARARLPDIPVFPAEGPALSAPKSAIWDVTYACNLRCPHCLTASGKARRDELDTAGALRLIDALVEAKVLTLSLSGGEPLLRPDILTLLRRLAETSMRVDIATNGVELPEPIIEALRGLPIFQIQVSLDGLGEAHDRFRGLPGAFEASCRTLRRLREEGIATSVSTTATRENIGDLDEIIDLALSLGCGGYKAIPFIAAGRGKAFTDRLRLRPEELATLTRVLARRGAELAGQMTVSTEGGFTFLLDHDHDPPTGAAQACNDDGPMGCSAGHDTISLGAEGKVYPCPFLHDFPLGHVLDGPLRALWAHAATLQKLRGLHKSDLDEPCRSCEHAPERCRGGCRAAAWLESGSLLGGDPCCFRELPPTVVRSASGEVHLPLTS